MSPEILARHRKLRSGLKIAAAVRDPSGYFRNRSIPQDKVLINPGAAPVNGNDNDFVVTFIGRYVNVRLRIFRGIHPNIAGTDEFGEMSHIITAFADCAVFLHRTV